MAQDAFGNYITGLESATAHFPYTNADFVQGHGPPGTDVPTWAVGYIDQDTGDLYLYIGGAWTVFSGGGGGGVVFAGAGAPAFSPAATSAVYFDTSTGTQYNWYSGAWH